MSRLLIVDNNIDPESHGCADILRCVRGALGDAEDLQPEVRRGPELQYEPDPGHYAGVIISGSKTRIEANAPWIDRQMEFLRALRAARIPTFGICYGEQLMIKAFCGDEFVRSAPHCEFGFVKVLKTAGADKSPFFSVLPQDFHSFCYHYDEVMRIPDEYLHTLRSEACEIHGFEVPDAPMWGIQFHPEKDLPGSLQSIEQIQREDTSVNVLNEETSRELFDPQVERLLFGKFIELVREHGQGS